MHSTTSVNIKTIVSEVIEPAIKGFEEALVEFSVKASNNVVSVDAPESADVRVLAFSPVTEDSSPDTDRSAVDDRCLPFGTLLAEGVAVLYLLGVLRDYMFSLTRNRTREACRACSR